jgi:hypothetical protein
MGTCTFVKCKIYSYVKGKDKLVTPKWDSLCKHVGHTKA